MRRGFTVLELLVASLLLGMIMVILTMIFNQSSIAWRTGVSGVRDMDDTRNSVSAAGTMADAAYIWDSKVFYIHSIFDEKGEMTKNRTEHINQDAEIHNAPDIGLSSHERKRSTDTSTESYALFSPPSTSGGNQPDSFSVNVMSYGPDREKETRYDNIYSTSPENDSSEW